MKVALMVCKNNFKDVKEIETINCTYESGLVLAQHHLMQSKDNYVIVENGRKFAILTKIIDFERIK